MVSICRTEEKSVPTSSATFSKLLEGGDQIQRSISVVDGEVTVTVTVAESEMWSREKCTTPTAKEFKIPEMLTCPPAPRKRRDSSSSFSRLPSSVRVKEYFVPPNLEAVFALSKFK
ncbi:hypothetical protein HHK36_020978 [Tetracentron sinense]|uniref:Uncharacterized protein n=1 Tax=Tetracentron sinense TaxID=13715 RepID=A0A834YZV7_TETSI|nr:hypothetical protein HHK36_020978 [Tetracentron sinense]